MYSTTDNDRINKANVIIVILPIPVTCSTGLSAQIRCIKYTYTHTHTGVAAYCLTCHKKVVMKQNKNGIPVPY
jgi:hypothetical protein